MTTSYKIKGLDCASCGLKIEDAIKKLPGVTYAVVDFANLRLHLEAADPVGVFDEIKRIEPAVEILPFTHGSERTDDEEQVFQPKRELAILAAALILFGVHAVFEDRFHESGGAIWDYGIALVAYFLAGINIYISAFRTIQKGDFFDENVLMVIATSGAIAIHALSEAVGVSHQID
jgi:Zn2+/Cd2+-exporting ATPase